MNDLATYRETMRRRGAERDRHRQQRSKQARELAERMASMLREQFGASRVVLFGSVARGTVPSVRSDIDLAAWGLEPMVHLRAVARLQDVSSAFDVDLVRMERCSSSLREAVEREGVEL